MVVLGRVTGEMVIQVAVEHLVPATRLGETQHIAAVRERCLPQTHDHDDIAAQTGYPSVEREHPAVVVGVKRVDRLGSQGRVTQPQPDQIRAELMEVGCLRVAAGKIRPADQEVALVRIVGPPSVCQEFLTHEDHRHTGRGEQEARRHPRPAAGQWAPVVVPVGALRDPWLAMIPIGVKHEIVVLDAVVDPPGLRHAERSPQTVP